MRALITGASSGIGEQLARMLAKKGYTLLLVGRDEARLRKVADITGGESFLIDLSEDRTALLERVRSDSFDLIVNNAGFGLYGSAAELSIEEQLKILEVNAAAAIEITLEGARAMIRADKRGVILNVSSVAGEFPTPGMAIYGASKACLTRFSEALDFELASKGVDILISAPGMIQTDFANRAARKRTTQKPAWLTLSASEAAEQIWSQIQKRKKKHLFPWPYRLRRLLPRMLTLQATWKSIKERL